MTFDILQFITFVFRLSFICVGVDIEKEVRLLPSRLSFLFLCPELFTLMRIQFTHL